MDTDMVLAAACGTRASSYTCVLLQHQLVASCGVQYGNHPCLMKNCEFRPGSCCRCEGCAWILTGLAAATDAATNPCASHDGACGAADPSCIQVNPTVLGFSQNKKRLCPNGCDLLCTWLHARDDMPWKRAYIRNHLSSTTMVLHAVSGTGCAN